MYKNRFFLFLNLLLLIGCKPATVNKVSLQLFDTIKIPLQTDVSLGARSNAKYYNWDGKNILATYTTFDKSIHLFDIDLKKETAKIDLSGLPNNEEVRAFTFLNKDTILLSIQFSWQYYIVNKNSDILKTFAIFPDEAKSIYDSVNESYGNSNDGADQNPITLINNKYICLYQGYYYTIPFFFKYNQIFILDYNLINDSIDIKIKHIINSEDIREKDKPWLGNESPNFSVYEDKLLISYYNSPNFKTINPETGEVNTIKSPTSNYFSFNVPFDTTKLNDAKYYTMHLLKSGGYKTIRYDPYSELYFRTVALPLEDDFTYVSPYINIDELKPYSLMIYNKNLKIINEIKFPAKYYNFPTSIFIPKGLCLDVANGYDPRFTTGLLEYDIFKINKE